MIDKYMGSYRLLKSYGYKKEKCIYRWEDALKKWIGMQKKIAKMYLKPLWNGKESDYKVRVYNPFTIQTSRNYYWKMESPYVADNTVLEAIHQWIVDENWLDFYPKTNETKRLREIFLKVIA